MRLERVEPEEIGGLLGLVLDEGGAVPTAALAPHARRALYRWGVVGERDIVAQLLQLLALAGVADEDSKERAKALVKLLPEIGEAERVIVEGQSRLLRALPRVVACGAVGFVTGTVDALRVSAAQFDAGEQPYSLTRWVPLEDGELDQRLSEEGYRVCSPTDWLGQPGYVEHLRRRGVQDAESKDLSELWTTLSDEMSRGSDPISDSESVRVLAGEPGAFFGSSSRDQRGARWRTAASVPDGTWCGARGGYGEGLTQPALIKVDGGVARRSRDLYDWDEWRWALLSRGAASASPERLEWDRGGVQQTCELPEQLLRLLRVTARRPAGAVWRWEIHPGAEDAVVGALKTVGGLA